MQSSLFHFTPVLKVHHPSSIYQIHRHNLQTEGHLCRPHLLLTKNALRTHITYLPKFIQICGCTENSIKLQEEELEEKFVEYRNNSKLNKYENMGWWVIIDQLCFWNINQKYTYQEVQQWKNGEQNRVGLFRSHQQQNQIITSFQFKGGKVILEGKNKFKWESQMQLQYKLKGFIQSVYQGKRLSNLSHVQMNLNSQTVLLIYNRQLLIYQSIEAYIHDEAGWNNELNVLSNHAQRLRYPLSYYSKVYNCYRQIVNKYDMTISYCQIIKLIKYSLIEHIELHQIFDQPREILVQIQAEMKEQELREDPVNNVIIFYLMLGMPGSNKTTVLEDLKKKLTLLNCSCLFLEPYESTSIRYNNFDHQLLKSFMSNEEIFQKERYSYVLLDLSFSYQLLTELLHEIEIHLPKSIHYQLLLIAPLISKQHHFQEEHLMSTISYLFPFDMIIASLMNVQCRKNHSTLNGNGVDSLAKILHYISSIYANIDIDLIVNKSKGNVEIIEYEPTAKINVQSVEEYDMEEIEDGLRVLLEMSYKSVYEKDALMCYFLQNLQKVQYEFDVGGIADQILSQTFKPLPYFQFS